MATFARIEDGKVAQVIVVNNSEIRDAKGVESEAKGLEFIASIGLDGEWVQTSYAGATRGKYAGIGDTYDPVTGFQEPSQVITTTAQELADAGLDAKAIETLSKS